jgi:hypothetical protein
LFPVLKQIRSLFSLVIADRISSVCIVQPWKIDKIHETYLIIPTMSLQYGHTAITIYNTRSILLNKTTIDWATRFIFQFAVSIPLQSSHSPPFA